MPDRDPSRPEFERAANRAAHEREQLAKTLSDDARRTLADAREKSRIEREQKEREQQKRYQADIEKRKARIRDAERMAYRPRWATDRMSEKRIQELAEKEVRDNNKAELATIDKNLEKSVDRILAAHAPDKKRELDEDRQATQRLADEKRRDRQVTRTDRQPGSERSGRESTDKSHARSDDYRQRVQTRIRKSRERDARAREHGYERDHGRE